MATQNNNHVSQPSLQLSATTWLSSSQWDVMYVINFWVVPLQGGFPGGSNGNCRQWVSTSSLLKGVSAARTQSSWLSWEDRSCLQRMQEKLGPSDCRAALTCPGPLLRTLLWERSQLLFLVKRYAFRASLLHHSNLYSSLLNFEPRLYKSWIWIDSTVGCFPQQMIDSWMHTGLNCEAKC